jgi:hypothetical protein
MGPARLRGIKNPEIQFPCQSLTPIFKMIILGVYVNNMLFLVVDLSSNLWYNTLHSEAGTPPDKLDRPSPDGHVTPLPKGRSRVFVCPAWYTARGRLSSYLS